MSRPSKFVVPAAVLTVVVLAYGIGSSAPGGDKAQPRSYVVYPTQSLPLRFSHAKHVGVIGADCEDCHEKAEESESSLDQLSPTEEACTSCHAIDRKKPQKVVKQGRPPARCDACHPGYTPGGSVPRVNIPAPNLKFNHKKHVGNGIECKQCHGDMVANKVDLATRDQLPKMQLCLDCHNKDRGLRQCTTCHLADAGNRMKTDYPNGKLTPSGVLRGDRHDLGFRTGHRFVAQNDPQYCESCHTKSFCNDCHNGVTKPMDFHVGDYVTLHPIDARRDQTKCSSCHRRQTFCTGCHARSGVAHDTRITEFIAPSLAPAGPRYHPPGWVEFGSGGLVQGARPASHHAFEAQRNIRSCASCHREEFCLDCHSRQTGSFSINPHPAGWAGSWRCRSLRSRAGRMCMRCHVDPRELTCDSSVMMRR